MKLRTAALAAILVRAASSSVVAQPPPEPVVRLITEAAATGNPAILKDTVDLAKRTYPTSAAEIDALVANLQAQSKSARLARLQQQDFFEGWSGEREVGADETTGTVQNTTVRPESS